MRASDLKKALPIALVLAVILATRKTVAGAMSLAELRLLALGVGFPDPDVAAAVAMAESGGRPAAVGDNGTSFGLWQVHTPAHPEFNATMLLDPQYNARAALAISAGGTTWQPWTTYRTGAYRQYLPAA